MTLNVGFIPGETGQEWIFLNFWANYPDDGSPEFMCNIVAACPTLGKPNWRLRGCRGMQPLAAPDTLYGSPELALEAFAEIIARERFHSTAD